MPARTKVQVVHFDGQHSEMKRLLAGLRQISHFDVSYTPIIATAAHWKCFRDAVANSTADLLVIVMHGTQNGSIGPLPSGEFRSVSSVFRNVRIKKEKIVLFCCYQKQSAVAWQAAAPKATIVVNNGAVAGAIQVIKEFDRSGAVSRKTKNGHWSTVCPR